ncbi:MAG: Imidazole glycerol phosphate synthase subunit HisH 1 [Syntrophorhabdaceae bacterium PtaU1.Bin034]|nr:MAG: Imidazole glycerol phosphate synthase subunit HisH 1 [Syntrophorhabdaceae bacterium PtaU1.Bin034]
MIAIVDYGMGNLRSVTNAFRSLGARITITRDERIIRDAKAIVLPGVGAFGKCVENLKKFGLFDLLKEQIARGKPYLGICLGMQILLESSEEAPGVEGMGVIKGRVVRFKGDMKIPHMGWNSVDIAKPGRIFEGIPKGSYFYFVHSYYPDPDASEGVSATITDYGIKFTSSVQKDNIFASQFHPEKSQHIGLTLLRNFVKSCE